jgi:tetratricopeptide (TPR) repeat protein
MQMVFLKKSPRISPARPQRRIVFLFLVFLTGFPAYAQQQIVRPWWYLLEQGKLYFRSGDYGYALTAFEDARRRRIDYFTRIEDDLIFFLSKPEVRPLGDSLEFIEWYIAERRETQAAAALSQLYYRVSKESLSGSVKAALRELDRLKSYPEADFWLGETYRAEGEIAIALSQYEKAWSSRALLENPGFETEILYKITEVHRLRRNYQEMERRAKEIIEGSGYNGLPRDALWSGAGANQIRAAMARILENEGISRFLNLYRHTNTDTERAHRLLGFFYYSTSRYIPAAEHLMFAFLIQNSVIIEEIIRGDFDFTFSNLENLFAIVKTKTELASFVDEVDYYRTIYYFASALYASGKSKPSLELWAFLAGSAGSGEWGERARRSPVPYTERPLEMP